MSPILINAIRETLVMLSSAGIISIVIGIPLGILVASINNNPYKIVQGIYYLLLSIIQLAKSMPFLILMVLFIPATNWLIGKHIAYSHAIILPLAAAGSLMLAYQVREIMQDLIVKWQDTQKILGANTKQAIRLIFIPEALPQIAKSTTNVLEMLVGFTTISGALGAGGLGQLAIEKSLGEPDHLCVLLSVLALLAIQQIIKYTGFLVVAQTQPG